MITIEEAASSYDTLIGIFILSFVILSFVAWIFTIRRERRMRKRIRKAVVKAEARTRAECHEEYHEKSLDNFMHWMDTRIELKKTKAELQELRRKYDLLRAAAEGCPGVTSAKI